ncbi:hypothetical protein UVI_02029420 [Ustilaginoidea virens]|uniref:Siderophore biosynthesis protein n=1 Tax=Ustilaginoidea virens TaxID=1159556 RepID=A0A1B5KVV6_USTVR|nr:hypothetical protein UVI_02029420 [Ustilaginoidea virens]
MAHQTLHLPDGKKFSVAPVFGGMGFRSLEHNSPLHPYPVGWMTVLHTEEERVDLDGHGPVDGGSGGSGGSSSQDGTPDKDAVVTNQHGSAVPKPKRRTKPFRTPTLHNDSLFISSISLPSNSECKPAVSPTREIAMMLWITLYWYFHQPEPDHSLETAASKNTPAGAKPLGEWTIRIKRDGVLRGRNLIPKLERMGLIASEDTSVGTAVDDNGDEWATMFTSKRMFWQSPGNLFLFTLQPIGKSLAPGLHSTPASPISSRPASPREDAFRLEHRHQLSSSGALTPSGGQLAADVPGAPMPTAVATAPSFPIGPYFSASHLPTFYPAPPLQYVFSDGIRHPLRPKPPRMGEVFYTRYIDSLGQYLSFRVASCSAQPVPYLGPVGPKPPEQAHLCNMCDKDLVQSWFENPRVKEFWGTCAPDFLESALRSKHSFPVVGLWDGVPFGYFELYWVKEDALGRHVGSEVGDWDRGIHIMVGEEWSRGRVAAWLTSLVHWCLTVMKHLDACGFAKEKQVSFPHKQAWYVRLKRESWNGPAL